MIGILKCGGGNSRSISNMLKVIGEQSFMIETVEDFKKADKIIMPGVGSYDSGMDRINDSNLRATLEQAVLVEKKPVLGICLGMQLFFERSDEGVKEGLGWIPGEVVAFNRDDIDGLPVPNMGWRGVYSSKQDVLGFNEFDKSRFYFVHSFHVDCIEEYVLARSEYGYGFVCSVRKGNIFGVQFHPEKSLRFGMNVLRKFANIV